MSGSSSFRPGCRLDPQHLDEEGPAVGGLLDDLGRRLAGAVAGPGLDADQDRVVARLGRLKRRGELEAVGRDDAVVVVGGGDERGRIAGPRLEVVQRAVGAERRNCSGSSDEP